MSERNKKTLDEALNRLPEHAPPAGAWVEIRNGLRPDLAERLPSYQPPPSVWNALNEDLKAAEAAPPAAATVRPLPATRPRLQWVFRGVAVAAAVALFLSLGLGLLGERAAEPTVTYAYSKVAAPTQQLEADWSEDEASFERVVSLLEERNEPSLNTLRMELDELTEAKRDVQAVLVAYGEDPAVIRQLAEIERGRSDVYRQIINEL